MANGDESVRSWVQWALGIIAAILMGTIGVGWTAYSDLDSRLDEKELRVVAMMTLLKVIDQKINTINETMQRNSADGQSFWEKRPVFWDDLEKLKAQLAQKKHTHN